MKRKKPSDIISETQRRQLREAGYVVVGRFLSKKMMEANNKIAGYGSQAAWGRAVLASLREQGEPDEGTTPYRE